MTDLLPAWSEPFHDGPPASTARLGLPGVTRAWAFGDGRGAGVRVAVIDSGIDAGHPLVGGVADAVAIGRDRDAPNGVRVIAGPHDDLYGHGTACAGIVRELAPAVELVSVRVLAANLRGSAIAFAQGLEWCLDHGVHVVNLSLSTTNDDMAPSFFELVDRATQRGMTIVSAMNNERRRSIPSEFAGVLSVACAPCADRETWRHRRGGPAEWGAAGIEVEVAWAGGATVVATGNSFAAPVITGHVARIIGAHPGIEPWQVRTVLAELAADAAA